jgi:hypothetical protein
MNDLEQRKKQLAELEKAEKDWHRLRTEAKYVYDTSEKELEMIRVVKKLILGYIDENYNINIHKVSVKDNSITNKTNASEILAPGPSRPSVAAPAERPLKADGKPIEKAQGDEKEGRAALENKKSGLLN